MTEPIDPFERDRLRLQGRDPDFEAECRAELEAQDAEDWELAKRPIPKLKVKALPPEMGLGVSVGLEFPPVAPELPAEAGRVIPFARPKRR